MGFASRLSVTALADALCRLCNCVQAYMPESVFAARVQAELIRLGTIKIAEGKD